MKWVDQANRVHRIPSNCLLPATLHVSPVRLVLWPTNNTKSLLISRYRAASHSVSSTINFNSQCSFMYIFRIWIRRGQKSSSSRHIKSVRTPGRLEQHRGQTRRRVDQFTGSNGYGPVTQGKTRVGQLIDRRDWFCDCGRIGARGCNGDCKRTTKPRVADAVGAIRQKYHLSKVEGFAGDLSTAEAFELLKT